MRSTLALTALAGYVAAQSSTVSVWDMEILRHFDQTMMGTIITEMPQATVLAYSCPDEIGCGTATITNGSSTFDATLVTSDVPGEAPGTLTEYIKCGVIGGTSADCTQSWVTVTNGQTGTILTTTTAESEIFMMEVVVPMTGGETSSTAYPTATPTTTKAPSTYTPPVTSPTTNCTTPVSTPSATSEYTTPPGSPSGSPTGITTQYPTSVPAPTGGNGTTSTPAPTTSAPPENVGATRAVGVFAAVGAAFGAAAFAL